MVTRLVPPARPHLEHFWLCSEVFGNTELIALSGFLDSPEAAKEAYEIGLLCEHGLEPAIIALLRMGDWRALELLDRRLNKDFPPISTKEHELKRTHSAGAVRKLGVHQYQIEHLLPRGLKGLQGRSNALNAESTNPLEHVKHDLEVPIVLLCDQNPSTLHLSPSPPQADIHRR